MNIAVVGTGYVGLVTGTCLAETGNQVVCIDVDEAKVELMKRGEVPIYEPGLQTLFDRNTRQGRLSFTTSLAEGCRDAEVIFFALPTPPNEDGSADLSYVLRVAEDLSALIDRYTVIVGKSTVPVGTADEVDAVLRKIVDPALYDVVSNPEFLREGVAVDDRNRMSTSPGNYGAIVQAIREAGQPHLFHGCAIRGNDKICGKQFPGYQDYLYERNGQFVRTPRGQY